MTSIFKVEPNTQKHIKNRDELYVCSDCKNKVQNFVKLKQKNLFKDVECAACSKYGSYKHVKKADYSSFILVLLDDGIGNELSVILRLTRDSDVQEKADGAVKISKAITNEYDVVQASVYTRKTDSNKSFTGEDILKMEFTNVYKTIKNIRQLNNFEYILEKHVGEEFIDVDIYIYHVNAPMPV